MNILWVERTGDIMIFPTISVDEVDRYIEEEQDMMLIDLRNQSSYNKCHIDGAVNIEYKDIESGRVSLPKDKLLMLYCSRGGQSLMACRNLSRHGYQVVNVANGIAYYRGKYLV